MRRLVVVLAAVIGLSIAAPVAMAETSATGRLTVGNPFWQFDTANSITVNGSAPAMSRISVYARKANLEPCAPDHLTDRSYNGTTIFTDTAEISADPFEFRTPSYSGFRAADRGLWRACIYLVHTELQTETTIGTGTFTFRVAPPCVVPATRGLTIARAKVALARGGCKFKALRSVDGSGVTAGRVVKSLPAAGRRLPPMTPVTLVYERA